MRFTHESLTQRVCFVPGEAPAAVRDEVRRLGATRVMVIAAAAEADLARQVTVDVPVVLHHNEAVMHVPAETAERARAAATAHRVDALVTVGGGSTTGLAKAIALTSGIPIVAVPTTYAGSEATSVWGLTEGARKMTGVDARVLPRSIVYDATVTLSLPVAMSVASGLNALAHCVDSMWAPRTDPVDQALAGEGIRALTAGLPSVVADPAGLEGREQMLYGAYLSAVAFSSAGSGLHHKICHVLGGTYDLPHAQTHAVVLPYVLAFNTPAAPEAERRIADAFGTASAIEGLQRLRQTVGAPSALRHHGFNEADIDAAANAILDVVPASNPRLVTAHRVRRLLRAAWEGADPLTMDDRPRKAWTQQSVVPPDPAIRDGHAGP
ncbi:maleylacetate reductase [Streptomyces sp. NPDC097610]|uniref:maleylacetate reductase n=1 Tax=Streptomyces sp. NPDC097610 TaxID=3157227 RepID=UPI003324BF1B